MVMAPPPARDSAVSPCFHGCRAFLHRHFPLQSPPSRPLNPALHSQTPALALGLLHNPQTPVPSHCTFQETRIPVRGTYGCGKDCLILLPFRLPQLSCFTLSLNVSPLIRQLPPRGDQTPASVPPPAEGRSSPTNSTVFPQLLHPTKFCVVPYFLFRWSGPPVWSQLVFCMHFCV